MEYFTIQDALSRSQYYGSPQVAQRILKEEVRNSNLQKTYDIFLSHSYADAQMILGAAEILRNAGYSVYVDWIEDAHLDRSNVTQESADLVRKRMRSCKWLVYATSENSSNSKWMPWELGYFDGFRPDCVAIFPLVRSSISTFKGQEYLSLYPTITKGLPSNSLGTRNPTSLKIYDGRLERTFKAA